MSVDFRTTIESLAKLAVSNLADWCGVFMIENDRTLRRVAVAQRMATGNEVPEPVDAVFPFDENEPDAILEALQAENPGFSAHVCVPVLSGSRISGLMVFALLGASRRFADDDVIVARDLASAAAVAMETAHMHRELQEMNRLKNEFVTMVSHELRTPLTPILGCVHLLRTAKLSDANFTRALEMIERNAQAQVQIVDDLLDVSRMIAGNLKIAIKAVDPAVFAGAAIDSLRSSAESKGVDLIPIFGAVPQPVEIDPDRLRQVIWNLVSNAIKFTPAGGRIEVSMIGIQGELEIRVTDTGAGISADVLPYIFDRFRQADDPSAKLRSGLGLGLAIVRHVVELHGGSVTATSPGVGRGACFIVRFPLLARKASTATS